MGPLWKLKENLGQCLALRDCHTHLLISAGIGWAGTLSGRRKVSRVYAIDAFILISAYQERAALVRPGQEAQTDTVVPRVPGWSGPVDREQG